MNQKRSAGDRVFAGGRSDRTYQQRDRRREPARSQLLSEPGAAKERRLEDHWSPLLKGLRTADVLAVDA